MLIQADLHCHSLASSHAYSTVDEMAAAARRYGLKAFSYGPCNVNAGCTP